VEYPRREGHRLLRARLLRVTRARGMTAEALGTGFLVAAVVGSGIMGERLAAGNVAVALLANTLATGATLIALILTFMRISGGHLNPAVTLARAASNTFAGIRPIDAPGFIVAQLGGAAAATLVSRWLVPSLAKDARAAVVSHPLSEHAPS
jgi:glycerol uptake facilitator-like aquaporin